MDNTICNHQKIKLSSADNLPYDKMADFFKAFSDPLRVRILLSLSEHELCVNNLVELLNVSQPRVSNQLKLLKQSDLIKLRKEKNHIFYSLNDNHIHDILKIGLEHISHLKEGEK